MYSCGWCECFLNVTKILQSTKEELQRMDMWKSRYDAVSAELQTAREKPDKNSGWRFSVSEEAEKEQKERETESHTHTHCGD